MLLLLTSGNGKAMGPPVVFMVAVWCWQRNTVLDKLWCELCWNQNAISPSVQCCLSNAVCPSPNYFHVGITKIVRPGLFWKFKILTDFCCSLHRTLLHLLHKFHTPSYIKFVFWLISGNMSAICIRLSFPSPVTSQGFGIKSKQDLTVDCKLLWKVVDYDSYIALYIHKM